MEILENSRKLKNPPNLWLLFVKITKFLEFSKKNNYKSYSFFKLWRETCCQFDTLEDLSSPLVKTARANPRNFCLKILREGGADGNLFGDEILPKLEAMETNSQIQKMYILMNKIEPDTSDNILGLPNFATVFFVADVLNKVMFGRWFFKVNNWEIFKNAL